MDTEIPTDKSAPGFGAAPGPQVMSDAAWPATLAAVASMLAGFAVLIMGNSLLSTLISLRMVQANHPAVVVGLVQSSYYIGFMFGAVWVGSLIERVGHHRAFVVFAALATCAALGYATTGMPVFWAMLRFTTGFCLVGIFTVMESWLQAAVPGSEFRGRIFSAYLITTYLGAGIGQFLVRLADPAGFMLFSLVGGLLAASLLPVTLAGNRPPQDAWRVRGSRPGLGLSGVRTVFQLAPLGLWGVLTAGLLSSAFYAMYPVFMRSVGYSVPEVSHFMGVSLVLALLPQWPIAYLSDRLDRRRVILAVSLALASSSLILLVFPNYRRLEPIAYLNVSLIFTVYGLVVSYVNDLIPPAQRVSVSAGLLLVFALGGSAGPTIASLSMSAAGPGGIYFLSATVTILLATMMLRNLAAHPEQNRTG